MRDLALIVTYMFGGVMLVGAIAGNRVAKNYGKSKVAGTIIGAAVGFASLTAYIRIKGKIDMDRMLEQQKLQEQNQIK
jgi:hypothetical protein